MTAPGRFDRLYADQQMVNVGLTPGVGLTLAPAVRGAIDNNLVAGAQDRLGFLAEQLVKGVLDADDWYARTTSLVRAVHSAAALAAAGGLDQLNEVHRAVLQERIAEQLAYLSNFADELRTGKQPLNGFVPVRARMYADAAVGTYEEVRRAGHEEAGYRWERRILDPRAATCLGCAKAAALGWQPLGTLPPSGSLECRTNCRCHWEYRMGDGEGAKNPAPVAPPAPSTPQIYPDAALPPMIPRLPSPHAPIVPIAPLPAFAVQAQPPARQLVVLVQAPDESLYEAAPEAVIVADPEFIPNRRFWTKRGGDFTHIDGTKVQRTPDGEYRVIDRTGKKIGQYRTAALAVRFVEGGGKKTVELATAPGGDPWQAWVLRSGPRRGQAGWKNSNTGRVVVGAKPVGRGAAQPQQAGAGRAPAAPKPAPRQGATPRGQAGVEGTAGTLLDPKYSMVSPAPASAAPKPQAATPAATAPVAPRPQTVPRPTVRRAAPRETRATVDEAHAAVQGLRSAPAKLHETVETLLSMSVKDLRQLQQRLGGKGGGAKQAMVGRIASGAMPPKPTATTTPQPTTPKPIPLHPVVASALKGVAASLTGNASLSKEQRNQYYAASRRVLAKMPPAAAKRFSEGARQVVFHSGEPALLEGIVASESDEYTTPEEIRTHYRGTQGLYVPDEEGRSGKVLVDGSTRSDTDFVGAARSNVHETYAHEFAHAIDGSNSELSRSSEWASAWREEIGSNYLHKGRKSPLSQYAMTDGVEGFAEFGRLVYGTDVDHAAVQKQFPKCAAFWKAQGLI